MGTRIRASGGQPRFTLIEGNFCREIGHIQKQSSFYFQAITALVTIRKNIVFNIPRAAVNFNDGFGGGADISQNLFFNTCRESSDHVAFNSWDRLPYITDIRDGTPSTIPAWNDVHHNFIVANYAADGGCLDNDDGSSYYRIHHNFCVFGGHKSDFDGNRKISDHNLHIYPSVYGVTCLNIGAQDLPPKGFAEGYTNNKCVLQDAGAPYLNIGGGLSPDTLASQDDVPGCLDGGRAIELFKDGLELGGNTVYVPGGTPTVKCGGKSLSAQAFRDKGYDPTLTVSADMPSVATMIGWAQELIGLETAVLV